MPCRCLTVRVLLSLTHMNVIVVGSGGIGADVIVVACTGRKDAVGEVFLIVAFRLVEPLLPSQLLVLEIRLLSPPSLLAGQQGGAGRDGAGLGGTGQGAGGEGRDFQ